jgi:transcriptional regulator with XRE-family HTH domain
MRLDQGNTAENSILTAASQRLGVHTMTVYKYITGQQYPGLSTVRRIEEEFHWSIPEQVRLIPAVPDGTDLSYGLVLAEVLRENFPDIEPGFADTGGRVKEARHRPSRGGWTHALVAKRLGCRVANVSRWLAGVRYPELRTVLRIARAFDWPATEQIVLIPEDGHTDDWATAFRAVLDREYPLKQDVTKITTGKA